MGVLVRGAIRVYQQAISPWLPGSCRFYPSCSQYCYEAVEKYGAIKGLWIGTKRVLRCHPMNPGGHDPVQ